MRVRAKVVGIGERKSGTSKKGRNYDFPPFHLIYQDKKTDGFTAACANVDQPILGCYSAAQKQCRSGILLSRGIAHVPFSCPANE